MKISQTTISILKNFASINQSIVINPGNLLVTMDNTPAIRAIAEVVEEFPTRIVIYDLNKFIGVLAMMGECEVDFQEKKVVLSSGKRRIDFLYSNAHITKEASTKRPKGEEIFAGHLTDRDVSTIQKASSVFSAPTLSFVGSGGKAVLFIGTPKSGSFGSQADSFQMDLGECDKDFDLRIPVELFKVMPTSYDFSLNKSVFIYLKSPTSVEYWIAGNPDSVV